MSALLAMGGAGLAARGAIGQGPGRAAASLRVLFPDAAGAAAIGRQYLRQQPQEASVDWLVRTLFGADLSFDAGHIGSEDARQRIRAGRARDFQDGNLVVVEGWFFPRTEARLLALVSMLEA